MVAACGPHAWGLLRSVATVLRRSTALQGVRSKLWQREGILAETKTMSKRIFDMIAAALGLLLFSPLLLLVAIWIKRDSPGPVFYRGRRAGRGGIPFAMLKFRSMVTDADRMGGPTTAGNDSRITPSGRFVRKYKVDELPQLINVLRGEMSLVGPRPEVVHKVDAYSWQERRILALRLESLIGHRSGIATKGECSLAHPTRTTPTSA